MLNGFHYIIGALIFSSCFLAAESVNDQAEKENFLLKAHLEGVLDLLRVEKTKNDHLKELLEKLSLQLAAARDALIQQAAIKSTVNEKEESRGSPSANQGKPSFINPKKVSNEEYQKFVNAIHYKPPAHWIEGQIPEGQEKAPVVNVNYKDAFLYTVWIGKRLPAYEELAYAKVSDGVIEDLGDGIGEWTSTPHLENGHEDAPIDDKNTEIGAVSFSGHLIYGKENAKFLLNSDCNTYTGFRLAEDKE